MIKTETLGSGLHRSGISRRAFLKYCASLSSLMALPVSLAPVMAQALKQSKRQSLIWLSFQECTGCTESFTRSHAPTIENLIFNFVSLDYHHTLQAASGEAAEAARKNAMDLSRGKYLLIVDGSIPVGDGGVYSTIAGITNLEMLRTCVKDAAAIIAVGSCAAFGGLPRAAPNPTGASSVSELMEGGVIAHRPLVNISGCPPLPAAISGTLAHYSMFDRFPALDHLGRPLAIYGNTVHERCSRLHFFEEQKFAKSFDDEGARKGWCLFELGCKGPMTHNACAIIKWNDGTSFPVESGHPCLGCSEPEFWDRGGIYKTLLPEQAPVAAANGREPGEVVFENNCSYCHSSGPELSSIEPDKIPELFGPDAFPAHRFTISDEEMASLVDYLKGLKTGQ
ncbi:MAG TPA: hydrogenase small subunit [Gammaproteobacteria bacterium]|nr:hydrogenase small subunit [Gammaproteobacteria bacterium]